MTQQQLADRVGCVQSLISLIERAVEPRVPEPETMVQIYRATNGAVTPNDLVFPDGLPDVSTPELPLEPAAAPLFDGLGGKENKCTNAPEAKLQAA